MKRPWLITLLAVVVSISAAVCALFVVYASFHKNSLSTTKPLTGWDLFLGLWILLLVIFFLALWAIGLFRFQRWSVVISGVFAAFFPIYCVTKLLLDRKAAGRISIWVLFFFSAMLTWYLLSRLHWQMLRFETPRARPLGITILCGMGAFSFALTPFVFSAIVHNRMPLWDSASITFNFALEFILVVGLWHLSEWARILTEVLAFFSPLGLLPILLGIHGHQPAMISIVIISAAFSIWSVLYMRSPAVIEAFQSDRRTESMLPTLCTLAFLLQSPA